jgi:hypothetical protein
MQGKIGLEECLVPPRMTDRLPVLLKWGLRPGPAEARQVTGGISGSELRGSARGFLNPRRSDYDPSRISAKGRDVEGLGCGAQ